MKKILGMKLLSLILAGVVAVGSIGAGGGTPTDYTGGAETAPDHIYVRCLIRAKP